MENFDPFESDKKNAKPLDVVDDLLVPSTVVTGGSSNVKVAVSSTGDATAPTANVPATNLLDFDDFDAPNDPVPAVDARRVQTEFAGSFEDDDMIEIPQESFTKLPDNMMVHHDDDEDEVEVEVASSVKAKKPSVDKKLEADKGAKKLKAAEEVAALKAAEELAALKAAEEVATSKAAEEAATLKEATALKAAEEAATLKAAEEAAVLKAAKEAADRKVAEDAADRKVAEEAAARKVAEEAAARKVAEEAAARKVAEEAAAHKVAEEAAARKVAEEAAAHKVAEETAARKAAEEAAASKAAEEAAARKVVEEAATRKVAEEATARKVAEEAAARKAAEEAAARMAAEEAAARKAAEEAAAHKAAEEAVARKVAEEASLTFSDPAGDAPMNFSRPVASILITEPTDDDAYEEPDSSFDDYVNVPAAPIVRSEIEAEKGVKRKVASPTLSPVEHVDLFGFLRHVPPTCVDLIYWRRPLRSAVALVASLALLISFAFFSVISVLANASLLLLVVTFSYVGFKKTVAAIQKTNEGHPFKDLLATPPQDLIPGGGDCLTRVAKEIMVRVGASALHLRHYFLVADVVDSLKFALTLYLLTYLGDAVNLLTLVTLGVIAIFSLPKIYEMNKRQIDSGVEQIMAQIQAQLPVYKALIFDRVVAVWQKVAVYVPGVGARQVETVKDK